MSKVTKLSASRIIDYKTCNLKFKYKHIDGMSFPSDTTPMKKGNLSHKLLEHVVSPVKSIKDVNLKSFDLTNEQIKEVYDYTKSFLAYPEFKEIIKEDGRTKVEGWLNLNRDLSLGRFNSFISGKYDYMKVNEDRAIIIDYKTSGKNKEAIQRFPSDPIQLELYAIWAFQMMKHLEEVECSFAYVKHDYFDRVRFTRDDLHDLIDGVDEIITTIEDDAKNDFPYMKCNAPRLCDWCEFKGRVCDGA